MRGLTMNEIVKYNNELNDIRLHKFGAMELDMLMLLCAKMRNNQSDELVFSFSDLKVALGIQKRTDKKLLDLLESMNKRLNSITCNIRTDTRRVSFTLFPTLDADEVTKTLTVSVNPKFSYLLNELGRNFTRFELTEFIKLESKYSKNLYRLLKQYRSTGTYTASMEDIRGLMDCPKSYQNKIFMRDCLGVAIHELSQYFDNLEVTPIKAHRRGSPIVAYQFSFTPEKPERSNKPDKPKSNNRTLSNKNNKFNNFDQRSYDWDEYEQKLLTSPDTDGIV